MTKTGKQWIEQLSLIRHPEGGYYRETYRSRDVITSAGLPSRYDTERSACTSIYYLLSSREKSHFHRLKSDELWYYHAGGPIRIMILGAGDLTTILLGANPQKGETFQCVIPGGSWFGAFLPDECEFCLCSCSVAPGFDFKDFEMASRDTLLKEFPLFKDEILMLTKS